MREFVGTAAEQLQPRRPQSATEIAAETCVVWHSTIYQYKQSDLT